jgi:two-component system cell cycle sensor histidine kinase/response regulator CckA
MEDKRASPKVRRTILVVDDDVMIRQSVSAIMAEGSHYNVLLGSSGPLGLQESRSFKGEIHLLLADFQMAGMSGIELATAMTLDRPNLKVLLMSGFPDGMLILNEGWHFLVKPFIPSQLRALVLGLVYPELDSKFASQEA